MKKLLFLTFVIFSFFGFSQQEKDTLVLKVDTQQVLESRSLSNDLTDKYIGEEFNYTQEQVVSENVIARAINWFFRTLEETFGVDLPPGLLILIKYLIYFLMGGLVIYLLIKLFISENISSIFTKKANAIININLSEEHIENLDLEALLKSALKQKDYRLAIRYQYLKALKLLSQQNIIDWHFEKTNLDYQKEIETPKVKLLFNEVSYLYDYIWYGEQKIDENDYNAADKRFVALQNIVPQ